MFPQVHAFIFFFLFSFFSFGCIYKKVSNLHVVDVTDLRWFSFPQGVRRYLQLFLVIHSGLILWVMLLVLQIVGAQWFCTQVVVVLYMLSSRSFQKIMLMHNRFEDIYSSQLLCINMILYSSVINEIKILS